MRARMLTFRAKDGNLAQVVRTVREIIVPAAERQHGFLGLTLMSDPDSGKLVSITFWQSQADLLASEHADYFQEQLSRVITLVSGPPVVEHFGIDVMS